MDIYSYLEERLHTLQTTYEQWQHEVQAQNAAYCAAIDELQKLSAFLATPAPERHPSSLYEQMQDMVADADGDPNSSSNT